MEVCYQLTEVQSRKWNAGIFHLREKKQNILTEPDFVHINIIESVTINLNGYKHCRTPKMTELMLPSVKYMNVLSY